MSTEKLCNHLLEDGLVEQLDDTVKLTDRGVFRGNEVFQQFLK